MNITILGLETRRPQVDRWESYKLRLQARGELVNADGTITLIDVREVITFIARRMSANTQWRGLLPPEPVEVF